MTRPRSEANGADQPNADTGNFVQRNYWGWKQMTGRGQLKRIIVFDATPETIRCTDLAYHCDIGNVLTIVETTT